MKHRHGLVIAMLYVEWVAAPPFTVHRPPNPRFNTSLFTLRLHQTDPKSCLEDFWNENR